MPKASINYPSLIVDRKGNGGWHKNGKRAYRRAVETISRCLPLYREARLYHLCFEGIDEGTSNKTNMAMLHALVQMAEREGIKCEWFGAREKADTTKKDHLHVFMLIDAYGIKVAKLFNQFEDGRVQQFCKAHGVKFGIFNPKDFLGIHGRNVYMALPYQGPGNRQTQLGIDRLEDALVWLSYLGKARSKPADDDKDGQIFPASRPNRKRSNPLPPAPQAEKEETIPEQTEGDDMQLTEAGFKYLGGIYESCVDQGLDIVQIQRYLSSKGISRSLREVKHELNNVFCFAGYAARHPAPPRDDLVRLDAAIDRMPLKSGCYQSTDFQHLDYSPVPPVRKIGIAISNSTVYSNTHY